MKAFWGHNLWFLLNALTFLHRSYKGVDCACFSRLDQIFLCITVGSLPYDINRHEATTAVIWYFINKPELNWNAFYWKVLIVFCQPQQPASVTWHSFTCLMFPKQSKAGRKWKKKDNTFLYHNFSTLWMRFIVLHGSWYDTTNLKDRIYIHRFLKLLLRHLNELPGHLYEWGLVYSTSFPMTAAIGSSSFLWPWTQVEKMDKDRRIFIYI